MKRKITLAVNNTDENIELIQKTCKELGLELKKTRFMKNYYYFYIVGDTADFNKLKEVFPNEIITTYHADLGNIADCDDEWLEKFEEALKLMNEAKNATSRANRYFHEFIMPIKDIEVLNAIEKYSAHMNDIQRETIRTRQDVLSGNKKAFEEEMTEVALSLDCDVKELRAKTGMSRADFAKYFGIPYRTVEDWENKKSTCSSYLFNLMKKDLERDGVV